MSDVAAPAPDAPADGPAPLRSVHTTTFAEILANRGISVLVTTYQAGKLVILRADNGLVNTHFRTFPKPMGLALDTARGGNRLAIGTAFEVCFYQNVPAVAAKLEPVGRHDVCYALLCAPPATLPSTKWPGPGLPRKRMTSCGSSILAFLSVHGRRIVPVPPAAGGLRLSRSRRRIAAT